MDKRTLLAVVLSLIVMMVWQMYFLPPVEQQESPGTRTPATLAQGTPADDRGASPEPPDQPREEATPVQAPVETQAWAESIPDQEAVIERSVFVATFTNHGGGVRRWQRKDYTEYRPGVGPIEVFKNLMAGKPLLPENDTRLDLLGGPYENSTPFRLNDVLDPAGTQEARCRLQSHDDTQVSFLCREGSVEIAKQYSVGADPNLLHLSVTLTNVGQRVVSAMPSFGVRGWVPAAKQRTFAPKAVPIYLVDGEVERIDVDDVEGSSKKVKGLLSWAGIDDKYFLRAIIPPTDKEGAVSIRAADVAKEAPPGEEGHGSPRIPMVTAVSAGRVDLSPGKSVSLTYDIFLGPKRSEVLKQYRRDLEDSLDFGMFGVFAEPILALLKWIYRLVGSYGVAIILLTIIIKTLFYPLMVKQMESAARMKEFQPQMAELREKYKDDKERLNQEMMRFMQEKKINPLGGCLPLLLQMPIWFALYRVLQNSIELYHTPFLYLPDLSERDPYGISPLILGGLMYVQQRMTPPAPGMDPMQAKMMQFLPLVFAVIMFSLPSGLVVYILVNTILTIIQQAVITRRTEAASSRQV